MNRQLSNKYSVFTMDIINPLLPSNQVFSIHNSQYLIH